MHTYIHTYIHTYTSLFISHSFFFNLEVYLDEQMNDWMFNDTPAQRLHVLLGVKQKVIIVKVKYNNDIFKISKVIKHCKELCNVFLKFLSQLYN